MIDSNRLEEIYNATCESNMRRVGGPMKLDVTLVLFIFLTDGGSFFK